MVKETCGRPKFPTPQVVEAIPNRFLGIPLGGIQGAHFVPRKAVGRWHDLNIIDDMKTCVRILYPNELTDHSVRQRKILWRQERPILRITPAG